MDGVLLKPEFKIAQLLRQNFLKSVEPVSELVSMLPTQRHPWSSITPHYRFVFTLILVLIFSDSA